MSTTSLASDAPPAPWRAHARGIAWWMHPDRESRERLSDTLVAAVGAEVTPLVTVGAMLDYDDTPVGAYGETLAIVVVRRGAELVTHVPFIAVDSAASVAGGRANWALPKTLARFDGAPERDAAMTAVGPEWAIAATPRAYGPPLPWILPAVASLVQVDPHGTQYSARPRGHGSARFARVTVQSTGSDVADFLPSGEFFGVLSDNLSGYLPAAALRSVVTS